MHRAILWFFGAFTTFDSLISRNIHITEILTGGVLVVYKVLLTIKCAKPL